MSMFSGKCDFCDSVVMIHCREDMEELEKFLARTDIYINSDKDKRAHKLDIKNEKDAVKYYPYLQSIAAYNKEGRNTIYLTSRPFIDDEEAEHIGWHIKDAYKYIRKCKRNKVEPSVEDYLSKVWWTSGDIDKTIIERIIKDGNKAEFDDLHDSLHEYYRSKWFEEMVKVGYKPKYAFDWCFNEFFPDDEVIKKRLDEELYVKYFT